MKAWAALALCTIALYGQIPGQNPPGTGPFPGGTYPGQDPTRRPTQGRRPDMRRSKAQPVITTTNGILRRYTPNQLVIEADDHRIVWYRTTDTTVFQKDGATADPTSWQLGDHVAVDSTADDEERFFASAIRYEKPGTPADRAAAARMWDLPALERGVTARAAPSPAPARASRGEDERPRMRRNDPPPAAPESQPEQPVQAQAQSQPPEEAERPATTVRPADAPLDEDDPGRPVLRRGVPAPRKRTVASSSEPISEPASGPAPTPEIYDPLGTGPASQPQPAAEPTPPVEKSEEEDPLLVKARVESATYANSLPNFFCRQTTTRYQTSNPKRGWDPLDVVTADLAYENGKESYKNIQVGGKPAKGSMEEIGGSSSTGEFQTILDEILTPGRGVFRRGGSEAIAGRDAVILKFEVPRENSRWRIQATSQLYYPAYRGSIWVDRETARVLRIEMQGQKMPERFSFDTIETAIDYSSVRLTPTHSYLLPVTAEMLSCQRGTSYCSRNRIEFRNYRKFGSETTVTFEDK